ncbi:MAG: LacI family DNA-binding transcriptional regulator [Rhodobacteraceae bacterium]|nr:LacI family DNA-binding transcriptional regulator [Paracoccaceae bacterium]
MAKRATVADVARQAGVSVATVDRVLNGRRRVRPATAEAVHTAAAEVGYHAAPLLAMRARQLVPYRKFGFVLQKESKEFYRGLADSLRSQTADLTVCNATCVIRFVNELAAAPIVQAMRDLADEQVSSIGVVALEHPHINDETKRLSRSGIPVWALLSSLSAPEVAGYIGIDARKAGRTAAWGISKCARPGSGIGVLVGSHRYRSHDDREGGFRSFFRECAPEFQLLPSISYLDNSAGAYEATSELVTRYPELGGLYIIGGGCSGAVRVLREESTAPGIAVVCHELTPLTRDALIDGIADLVIQSPIEAIAEAAVRALAGIDPRPKPLEFRIWVSENI